MLILNDLNIFWSKASTMIRILVILQIADNKRMQYKFQPVVNDKHSNELHHVYEMYKTLSPLNELYDLMILFLKIWVPIQFQRNQL